MEKGRQAGAGCRVKPAPKDEGPDIPAAFKADVETSAPVVAALRHVEPRRSDNDFVAKTQRALRRLAWKIHCVGGGIAGDRVRAKELRHQAVGLRASAPGLARRSPLQAEETLRTAEALERRAAEIELLIAAAGDAISTAELERAAALAENAVLEPEAELAKYVNARLSPPAEVVELYQAAVRDAATKRAAHRKAVADLEPVHAEVAKAASAFRRAIASMLLAELPDLGRAVAELVAGDSMLRSHPTLTTSATAQVDKLVGEADRVLALAAGLDCDGADLFEEALGAEARAVLRARGRLMVCEFEGEDNGPRFSRPIAAWTHHSAF